MAHTVPYRPPAVGRDPLRLQTLSLVLAALVGLAAAACGPSRPPLPPDALRDLAGAESFAAAFDADAERHRLVLLLSPT